MICEKLRTMHILLLLDGMSWICLLGPFSLWYCSNLLFPYRFPVWMIHPLLKGGIEIPYYYRGPTSLFSCINICPIYFNALMFGAYIFMIFPLDVLALLSYFDLLCLFWQLLTFFFWDKYSPTGSLLVTTFLEYLFHLFTFILHGSWNLKWVSYRQHKVGSDSISSDFRI